MVLIVFFSLSFPLCSSINVSEAESETSNRSSTGKDFEMVDENEVDTS